MTIKLATITTDSLKDAIQQVLNNPTFRQKAQLRSKLFQDQSETPLERAIWWCEYILRNPDVSVLKSRSMDLNLLQRQSIDVIAFLTIVTLVLFLIFTYIIWKIIKRCSRKATRKGNKKGKLE